MGDNDLAFPTPLAAKLAALLHPLTVDHFLSHLFFKKPVYIPGSHEKLNLLPTRDGLATLLEGADDVRAVFQELKQATISHRDASDMHAAGATICATGLENADSSLMTLCNDIRTTLRYTGQILVRGYWSPPAAGFAAHYDPLVTTNIQISGQKRWWYAENPIEPMPLWNSPYPLPDEYMATLVPGRISSVLLNPGDIICLPPGTVHWASANGGESLGLNIAFDYVGNGVGDVVASIIRNELLKNPSFRLPLYRTCSTAGDWSDAEMIASLQAACAKAAAHLQSLHSCPEKLSGLLASYSDDEMY